MLDNQTGDGKSTIYVLGRQKSARELSRAQTRLDVVKALFGSFVDRSEALDLALEMGLVSFGSDVEVECELTPLYEKFRERVNDMCTSGDTRCRDAVLHAVAMLTARRDALPGESPKLRVILLTDGDDNKSNTSVADLAHALSDADVVLDALTIATERSPDLRALTHLTGGYAIQPASLEDGLSTMQLETFLLPALRLASAAARRGSASDRLRAAARAPWDVVDGATVSAGVHPSHRCSRELAGDDDATSMP
jgi:uncharacterized protein YegL